MVSNREAGIRFRNEVVLYLQANGVPARDPFEGKRLSELVGDPECYSDVAGVEPWVIDIRTGRGLELSSGLADARRSALATGSEWYATVQARRGHALAETYVTLPLHVFARILRDEAP